jgi:hypothetical protein
VDALLAALQESTRERVPIGWADAQNNLGIALRTLGARESGTVRLDELIEFRRMIVKACRREEPTEIDGEAEEEGGA